MRDALPCQKFQNRTLPPPGLTGQPGCLQRPSYLAVLSPWASFFLPWLTLSLAQARARQTRVCQRVDSCLGGSEEHCDILVPPQNIISVCLKVHH